MKIKSIAVLFGFLIPLLPVTLLGGAANAQCFSNQFRGTAAKTDRPIDHAPVTPEMISELNAKIASNGKRSANRALTTRTVKVWVHKLRGDHRYERYISDTRVNKSIQVLKRAYNWGQRAAQFDTKIRFEVIGSDKTQRDAWFHAGVDTAAEAAMKRALHKGGRRVLNIYFTKPATPEGILGWATWPWDYDRTPRLDGVVVNTGTTPGGGMAPYNLGDTLVHEVGHWLGLFHTFEDLNVDGDSDPCTGDTDLVTPDLTTVDDTPNETDPGYGCPDGRDTCDLSAGLDPIHNFMDYSDDSCMNRFTQGQAEQMDTIWAMYRN